MSTQDSRLKLDISSQFPRESRNIQIEGLDEEHGNAIEKGMGEDTREERARPNKQPSQKHSPDDRRHELPRIEVNDGEKQG